MNETVLFHITPRKNLESIAVLGLIPEYSSGLSCWRPHHRLSVVWLTDNPDYILEAQAGDRWIRDNDPVILKVNCKDLDVKPYISYSGEKAKHEYYHDGIIKHRFGVEI